MQFSIELYKVITFLPQKPWYFCSKEIKMREVLFKQPLTCSASDNQGILLHMSSIIILTSQIFASSIAVFVHSVVMMEMKALFG